MASPKRSTGLIRDKGVRVEYDAKEIRGINGAKVWTRATQYFSHFMGVVADVSGDYTETKTGTGAIAFLASNLGGVLSLPTTAASGDALAEVLKVRWNPSKQSLERPLSFETRALLTSTANVEVAFGWTDQTAVASGIAYTFSAASAVTTSTPVDGAAFVFSSVATSGALNGVIGGVTSIASADTAFGTATAPDTNYHLYRIDVGVNGEAWFYLDDKLVKFVNGALTANSVLSPFYQVITRTTAAKEVDADYLLASGGLASTTT